MAFKFNGIYYQERIPDVTLGGCIEIYENILPNPIGTIKDIEKEVLNPDSGVSWTRAGTIGAGAFQNARTNRLMDITYTSDVFNNPVVQNLNNLFHSLLIATTNSYASRFNINENFHLENFQLLKYSGGEEYKAHYDGGTSIGRCISALCYMNDNYEGGEIEFVNFGIKIKPQAGMMILFPSNYAYSHVAHPVTKGTKYALVTWVRDRIV
jgi:hypothetical protein